MYVTLTPAYGRDYKSAKSVKDDWNAGKDFIIADMSSRWDSKPANKQDMAGQSVLLRYAKLAKLVVVK